MSSEEISSKAPKVAPGKKTVAIKKEAKVKADKPIKYADKSAGQPELTVIFNAIKVLMEPYAKGTIKENTGTGGTYGLVSKKAVEIEGRKKDEVHFAGLMVQKGYVGFYFMPVYVEPEIRKVFKPELLKCLKGKSCFHIKKHDKVILEQIEEALQTGYEIYEQKGWI